MEISEIKCQLDIISSEIDSLEFLYDRGDVRKAYAQNELLFINNRLSLYEYEIEELEK